MVERTSVNRVSISSWPHCELFTVLDILQRQRRVYMESRLWGALQLLESIATTYLPRQILQRSAASVTDQVASGVEGYARV